MRSEVREPARSQVRKGTSTENEALLANFYPARIKSSHGRRKVRPVKMRACLQVVSYPDPFSAKR